VLGRCTGPGRLIRQPGKSDSDAVSTGLTVLGNVAIDRVDGAEPTPGGCPSFIGPALISTPGEARVVTRMSSDDAPFFAAQLANYPVPVTVLSAARTNRFRLSYDGEERRMMVDEVGDTWTTDDIDTASISTEWVHVAPLLRDEFPVTTLRYLVEGGHRISFDGQGIVRGSEIGALREDDRYDPATLETLDILKVAEDEALVIAGEMSWEAQMVRLEVPEVVATLGSAGCDIFTGEVRIHVPVARPVAGVHTTGAGEVFAVTYAALRASGMDPEDAASRASVKVAEMLESRLENRSPRTMERATSR